MSWNENRSNRFSRFHKRVVFFLAFIFLILNSQVILALTDSASVGPAFTFQIQGLGDAGYGTTVPVIAYSDTPYDSGHGSCPGTHLSAASTQIPTPVVRVPYSGHYRVDLYWTLFNANWNSAGNQNFTFVVAPNGYNGLPVQTVSYNMGVVGAGWYCAPYSRLANFYMDLSAGDTIPYVTVQLSGAGNGIVIQQLGISVRYCGSYGSPNC